MKNSFSRPRYFDASPSAFMASFGFHRADTRFVRGSSVCTPVLQGEGTIRNFVHDTIQLSFADKPADSPRGDRRMNTATVLRRAFLLEMTSNRVAFPSQVRLKNATRFISCFTYRFRYQTLDFFSRSIKRLAALPDLHRRFPSQCSGLVRIR